eukprot:PhF_6_TR7873/c0_g1_i3/m.11527
MSAPLDIVVPHARAHRVVKGVPPVDTDHHVLSVLVGQQNLVEDTDSVIVARMGLVYVAVHPDTSGMTAMDDAQETQSYAPVTACAIKGDANVLKVTAKMIARLNVVTDTRIHLPTQRLPMTRWSCAVVVECVPWVNACAKMATLEVRVRRNVLEAGRHLAHDMVCVMPITEHVHVTTTLR